MRFTSRTAAIFGLLASTIPVSSSVSATETWWPSHNLFDPPRLYITPNASDLTYTTPSPDGIPYSWLVSPRNEQVNFGYFVGALSWWDPSNPPETPGWTHNTNWVALNLAKTTWVTIAVGPTVPLPCEATTQPAACNDTGRTGSDIYPAISLYRGQDTTSPQDHVFNPIGNFWAKGLTYLDSSFKAHRVTHVLFYKKKLPAGKYTINIGGAGAKSPWCHQGDPCYSGGQGYQATIKAIPVDW